MVRHGSITYVAAVRLKITPACVFVLSPKPERCLQLRTCGRLGVNSTGRLRAAPLAGSSVTCQSRLSILSVTEQILQLTSTALIMRCVSHEKRWLRATRKVHADIPETAGGTASQCAGT